jgi:hypothetical protein
MRVKFLLGFKPFRKGTKIQIVGISAVAVFPTLALHDHEKGRVTANVHDRQKKFHQSRGSLN